jgi:hypothetical protein
MKNSLEILRAPASVYQASFPLLCGNNALIMNPGIKLASGPGLLHNTALIHVLIVYPAKIRKESQMTAHPDFLCPPSFIE